ncbi:cytidylyltransferase domain-containing protein [Pseudodesulfovibrio sediminis]|uniref:Acylneuraminate cytidylyltransferase n=1 Tax=Pseudodesulfovibrio sediminis TaxID=2810563 RepID=A0ABM9SDT1_9BACT|nr:NTP transferase domain-containing protein [Pseudodesulfovibrio sediminis]BCS89190.1 hypothetical protein PSDVSF_24320 [Pseudodesulfovibrio sediminis]
MRMLGIIQCRISSTRLPGKALMDLGGRTILERVVARSLMAKELDQVVLATSIEPEDDGVVEVGEAMNIPVVRGELDDVLARYMTVLKAYPADGVVRITADNPFTDPVSVDRVCRVFMDEGLDYAYAACIPYGAGADAFKSSMLEQVWRDSTLPRHREHINTWFLDNHLACSIGSVPAHPGESRPDVSVTLDTAEDLARLRQLVLLLDNADTASLEAVIRAYDSLPAVVR